MSRSSKEIRDSPRKCPGVSGDGSEGSEGRSVMGREFKIASMRTSTVFGFSKVSVAVPRALYKCYLIDLLLLPTSHQNEASGAE